MIRCLATVACLGGFIVVWPAVVEAKDETKPGPIISDATDRRLLLEANDTALVADERAVFMPVQVRINGLTSKDVVTVAGHRLAIDGENVVKLPPGQHSLTIRHQNVDVSMSLEVQPRMGIVVTMPAIVELIVARKRAQLALGATCSKPRALPDRLQIKPGKHVLCVMLPEHKTIKRELTLQAGAVVRQRFATEAFQMRQEWSDFHAVRARRKTGMLIAGSGAAVALSSVFFALKASALRSEADDWYLQYQQAQTVDMAREAERELELADNANVRWQWATVGSGIVAAGLVGWGVWKIIRNVPKRPSNISLAPLWRRNSQHDVAGLTISMAFK